MEDLQGKVAVVTGAASGIGEALVYGFAAAGMRTVVADIDIDNAEKVAGRLGGKGSATMAVRVDVSDPASVDALADAVYAEFGAAHVVCNNAGVLLFTEFGESTLEDWQWVYGVNVMGTIHGVLSFLPRMQEGGEPGHIVNTASIAALGATGIYGTSKAAILTLTESLADELDGSPIGVTALFPGQLRSMITDAERNRPADLGEKRNHPYKEYAGKVGLDPSTCADRLIDAIKAGDRYVFAGIPESPEYGFATIEQRRHDAIMAAIEAGVVPES
ncbi:MAG: SDR family NAD(P)-dependent oxidoreductase [Acidimicrobiales bacterium]|nr:SDR family NAD(P)-dependent oxidoreductase [Acidimicrobiales bacterium]